MGYADPADACPDMNPLVSKILARHDAGADVEAIRVAEGCGFGYVYSVLREHRKDRPRQPRTRTSEKRKLILGLLATGFGARQVAKMTKCTPAYVYALIKQEEAAA